MSFHTHHGPSFQRLYGDTPSRRLVETCDWYSNLDAAYPNPPEWADVVLDYRITRQSHSGADGAECHGSGGSCDDGRNDPLPAVIGMPRLVWKSEMPGWSLEGFTVRGVHRHTQVLRFTDPEGFRGAFVLSGKEGTLAQRKRNDFDEAPFEPGRFTHLFPTADIDLLSSLQGPPGNMRSKHAPPVYPPLRDVATEEARPPAAERDTGTPDAGTPDAGTSDAEVSEVSASRLYRLPVLRDALRDPAGWFEMTGMDPRAWQTLRCDAAPSRTAWAATAHLAETAEDITDEGTAAQHADAMGPDCPVSPDRVLLSYAMAGHRSYAPFARFVEAGMDAAELARWRAGEVGKSNPSTFRFTNDDAILDWFAVVGGGGKSRRNAIAFARAGVDPAVAYRWKVLGDTPSSYADHIEGFEAAGWEPKDVRRVGAALADVVPSRGWTPPMNRASFKSVAQWTFTTAQAALDFRVCGYTATQAQALCEEAEDVAMVCASMAAMATLRRDVVAPTPAW